MFTVKAISQGGEAVFEATNVRRIMPGSGSCAVPGILIENGDEAAVHLTFRDEGDEPKVDGVVYREVDLVYVMNRHGATVATYRPEFRRPLRPANVPGLSVAAADEAYRNAPRDGLMSALQR